MPEYPDIIVYLERLQPRVKGQVLERVRLASPFLLRTVDPPLGAVEGKNVQDLRRLGKRIVFCLEQDLFLVLHLMIAGRLHWKERGALPENRPGGFRLAPAELSHSGHEAGAKRKPPRRPIWSAAFDFPSGTLTLTEAGTKKRASLHLLRGEHALAELNPGGLEVLEADEATFRNALLRENHTLKRALTDPRLFSGIGNAYSDEILHGAGLSPLALTQRLSQEEIGKLFESARRTLLDWAERLRRVAGDGFPEGVTAFREGMAVHGRYGKPCPVCGSAIQRIIYAENETNYCPRCQTGGKLLADRSMSRLLKNDWPRTIEEWELAKKPTTTIPNTLRK